MHIIIVGNPVDGLTFYGPYNTQQEALDAAEQNIQGEDWWVDDLEDIES